ncbi:MAG: hypothetical protein Q8P15_02730 [Nanoarchaeota archaeon]|nr:hypothetical protein [Nanoarchaeota archaeon]
MPKIQYYCDNRFHSDGISAADIYGREAYHLPMEKRFMTPSQMKAVDERSTLEIMNEDGEIPTFFSPSFRTIQ